MAAIIAQTPPMMATVRGIQAFEGRSSIMFFHPFFLMLNSCLRHVNGQIIDERDFVGADGTFKGLGEFRFKTHVSIQSCYLPSKNRMLTCAGDHYLGHRKYLSLLSPPSDIHPVYPESVRTSQKDQLLAQEGPPITLRSAPGTRRFMIA